jgi:predicted transposase/invertase (TIGR01784 family)
LAGSDAAQAFGLKALVGGLKRRPGFWARTRSLRWHQSWMGNGMEILDPKNDVVFKLLFSRNPSLLCSFLSAVLRREVMTVDVRPAELPKMAMSERGVVLDVRAVLGGGEQVDIEMQSRRHPHLGARALYYWAKMYGSQLAPGDLYAELAPCISIFVCDFRAPAQRFHSRYQVLETGSGHRLSEHLAIHVVSLKHLEEAGLERGDALLRWGRFFAAERDEERQRMATEDPMIAEAQRVLSDLSADPEARELARLREDARRNVIAYATEAREEGRTEGREEARDAMARVLEQMLRVKFGELSTEVSERILAANLPELQAMFGRVLSANRLEEVFL